VIGVGVRPRIGLAERPNRNRQGRERE
jgi:hypothetical protein